MLTEEDLIAAQDEELQELEWGTIPAADKFEREEAAAEELDAVHKLEEGLFWAARAGNVEVATAVIQLGASAIAHRGEWVYGPPLTPMYIAAQAGHTEIVRLLIRTVRTAAARWRKPALVANYLNQAGPQGETALMVAVKQTHINVVELLLQNRASVNMKDGGGDTALHFAAKTWDVSGSMALLLAHGADIEATNNAGRTALSSCLLEPVTGAGFHQPATNRAKWLVKKGASLAGLLHNIAAPIFIFGNLTSAIMAEQAKYIVPLLEHHRPDVRANSMRVLEMVTAADISERAATILRMLVRLDRTYTGVLEPLRAHLFPADVARRAFVTRKKFVEAIAARRTDAVPMVRDMAMRWIHREIPLDGVSANVLVVAIQAQTHM